MSVKRAAGILLHITSLPGAYGIGDIGPNAYAFIDFLKASGMRYWQVLPINPTDGINGHSPYSSLSAFAGNSLLISPESLVKQGWLKAQEIKPKSALTVTVVDYVKVIAYKEHILSIAYASFLKQKPSEDYLSFIEDHRYWLEDYALFMAAKAQYQGRCWNEWPKDLKARKPAALKKLLISQSNLIDKIKFTQYVFFSQWQALKKYANNQGIAIIGDIPIYVNYDSVDVWCHPSYFKLDTNGNLKFVSGCPPDYFSKTGQRWGNPVYDWVHLKKDRYAWWIKRIKHNLSLCDYLRIDHFRGFLSFWQIPAHEKLAVFGRWVKGPGNYFFQELLRQMGRLPIIAEDLGEITPDVPALMKRFHIPGMRVLLFAFGGDVKTNPHAPKNYTASEVVYTGTHDNNTIKGWYYHEAKTYERAHLKLVLGKAVKPTHLHLQMIKVLLDSKAGKAIIPIQDILGLGQEARMNTPATKVNNWQWRMQQSACSKVLAKKIYAMLKVSKRLG